MLELYKKMYATLVGRVDGAIDKLERAASRDIYDRQTFRTVAEELRRALLETEEMYLDGTEE